MNASDYIGAAGVSLLLLAFGLNIISFVSNKSYLYLSLNFIGALTATIASVLINYVPFIVLEGVWSLVSLLGILSKYYGKKQNN